MLRKVLALALVFGACSGSDDPTTEPLGPETCDNGVDDNGNGLVDCDDKAFCGGLACATTGDDDDDTVVTLPDVEIDFDGTDVEFTFTPAANCAQPVRSFTVLNRNEDVDAVVDASCDFVNGSVAAFGWDVDGANPRQFVVDEELPAATSMELGLIFSCRNLNEPFTATCRMKVDLGGLVDEVEFSVNGTPQ